VTRRTRPISWLRAVRKEFETFPGPVRTEAVRALTVAAEGAKADNVKPLKGFGAGVLEIVLKHDGNAFRVLYAVQLDDDIWVFHVFQKKSTHGSETPKHEIETAHKRLTRLKEMLR
jgi:phage-related protein